MEYTYTIESAVTQARSPQLDGNGKTEFYKERIRPIKANPARAIQVVGQRQLTAFESECGRSEGNLVSYNRHPVSAEQEKSSLKNFLRWLTYGDT